MGEGDFMHFSSITKQVTNLSFKPPGSYDAFVPQSRTLWDIIGKAYGSGWKEARVDYPLFGWVNHYTMIFFFTVGFLLAYSICFCFAQWALIF